MPLRGTQAWMAALCSFRSVRSTKIATSHGARSAKMSLPSLRTRSD